MLIHLAIFLLGYMIWADIGLSQQDTEQLDQPPVTQAGTQARPSQKLLQELQEFRSQRHRWDRAVRGFRNDHHFLISSGLDRGVWTGFIGSREQGAFEIETSLPFLHLAYSFHIPLLRDFGLGYYIGTKARIYFLESASSDEPYRRPRIYGLPGGLGGLVWNASPVLRFGLGIEAAPLRVDHFQLVDREDAVPMSATAQVVSRRISAEFFFRLGHGLSLEYERYRLTHDSRNLVRLRRQGETWSFGLVRHLI